MCQGKMKLILLKLVMMALKIDSVYSFESFAILYPLV